MNAPSHALIVLLLAPIAGCAATPATVIEGTATHRERIALPPDAEFEAVLQDVSRADAPAMELGRTTIPNAPMPPIRFTIPYDAAAIVPSHSYAVRAVIRVDGKLWFTSDTHHPVLTRGAGHTVDILLKRVAEPPKADAALLNTYWRILSLAGEPVTVAEDRREPHVILRSADGRDSWSATAGCNALSGDLTVTGAQIAFGPGASTRMACPPPLDMLARSLGQALAASTQWRIEGDRLELLDEAGVQTLLCEAAAADRSADEAALREIKEVLWPKAYFEQDTELLGRLLAPEFQMVDGDGNWTTRADELDWVSKNKPGYDSLTFELKRLEVFENGTAIAAGTGTIRGTDEDGPYVAQYQSTNVLIKRNGVWRAIASHVSGYKKTG